MQLIKVKTAASFFIYIFLLIHLKLRYNKISIEKPSRLIQNKDINGMQFKKNQIARSIFLSINLKKSIRKSVFLIKRRV
jgi:hypothetical protein